MIADHFPDSAFPPADHRQALAVLGTLGATGWAMYPDVGLPYHAWPEPVMAAVLAEAHGALLIAAPAQDASIGDAGLGAQLADALLAVARTLGLPRPVLSVDVEEGTWAAWPAEATRCAAAFATRALAAGALAAPYGPVAFACHLAGLPAGGGRPDAVWCAGPSPIFDREPDPAAIPGLPGGLFRGWRAWQYAWDRWANGLQVDVSVSGFALARVSDPPRPTPPPRAVASVDLSLAGRPLRVTIAEEQ